MHFYHFSTFLLLVVAWEILSSVNVRAQRDEEEYHKQTSIHTDESGVFNFNAELYLNYSDTLSDIGASVTTWSDYAAASAVHMIQNDGAYDPYGIVFLFERNSAPVRLSDTWVDTGRIYQSGVAGDQYGASMDMGENVLVVGAPGDSRQSNHNGAAYLYFGNDLDKTVVLLPDEGEDYSYFGASVAVDHGDAAAVSSSLVGGVVVVGAYGHYREGDKPDTGMVYVYTKLYSTTVFNSFTWTLAWRLQPSHMASYSQFGKSVSCSGNVLAVGAPGIDCVFVFILHHRKERERIQREREEAAEAEEREQQEHEEEQAREEEEYYMEMEREREEENNRRYEEDQNYEEGEDDYPRRQLRRSLQEDREHEREGEDKDREHEEQERREQEEREKEEEDKKDEENKGPFSDWEFFEVLVVSTAMGHPVLLDAPPPPGHDEDFGSSVSVTNYSSVVTLAVGASTDDSGGDGEDGGVYIVSMVNKRDLYSEYHINHRRRSLQNYQNRNEPEAPEEPMDEYPRWDVLTDRYNADDDGNMWILEQVMYGSQHDERFGSTVSLSGAALAVGGSGETYTGKVVIYNRVPSTSDYFFKDMVLRGPLHNTAWELVSTIYDADGEEGNSFGSALQLRGEDTVVIGSSLMNYGHGSVYVYSTQSIDYAEVERGEEDENADTDSSADTDDGGADGGSSESGGSSEADGDSSESDPTGDGNGSSDANDNASGDEDGVEVEGTDDAILTVSADHTQSRFSLQPYLLSGVGALLICCGLVRLRYCCTKSKKKNKNNDKGVNSLNDIDLSTSSAHPMMMDTSMNSSSSSVQMVHTPDYTQHRPGSVRGGYGGGRGLSGGRPIMTSHSPRPQSKRRQKHPQPTNRVSYNQVKRGQSRSIVDNTI